MMRKTGEYERTSLGGEEVASFIPDPLPPNPRIFVEEMLIEQLKQAEEALRRLDVAGEMVPSLDWFIYAFVRKEAVLSSQIEGTQATLVELLTFEAEESSVPSADIEEVCNYCDALSFARAQIADPQGLPLSMRLLNETHKRLMRGVRGSTRQPGEVRWSQNWIGGSRPGNAMYVPPPPHRLADLLSSFERYIHSEDGLPPLIRAGLLHVQFETIHPYLDGNGRIGRLLVTLLLQHWKLLAKPLLYLSLFLKRHRDEYYRLLNVVRKEGDWEGWLDFFLDGVATIAEEATASARDLFALVTTDRERILAHESASVTAIRLFEALPRRPIVTIGSAMTLLAASKPTAARAIDMLIEAGVIREVTGRKRDRAFAYHAYLERLRDGTDFPELVQSPAPMRRT